MKVTVVLALPDRQWVEALELPEGATVAQAIAAAALEARFPRVATASMRVGIWNKACTRETALREGDRVELYREIRADAKEMRRTRAGATPSRRARNAR